MRHPEHIMCPVTHTVLMGLLELPDAVLLQICEHFNDHEICRLQAACKRFRQLLPLTRTSRAFPASWRIHKPDKWDGYAVAYLADCSGIPHC